MRGRELRKLKPTGPVAIKHVKELSDLCVCHVVIAEREQGPPELVARDRPVRVRVPVTEEVDHAHSVADEDAPQLLNYGLCTRPVEGDCG